MARYFFNFRDSDYFIFDDEGKLCPNLEAVERETLVALGQILADTAPKNSITMEVEVNDDQGIAVVNGRLTVHLTRGLK
jgi:hypothetical protein